jgi:hypothetical protein
MRLFIYDAETRSTLKLKQFGSFIYLNHPSTDVWCVSYCTMLDGVRGPISTWKPGEPVPDEVPEAYADPDALPPPHGGVHFGQCVMVGSSRWWGLLATCTFLHTPGAHSFVAFKTLRICIVQNVL